MNEEELKIKIKKVIDELKIYCDTCNPKIDLDEDDIA